jgi:putative ABC transport system ATP-binding protein
MLTVQGICKTFSGSSIPALTDVHLALATGDFCVLIGANGSGKSTLMKVIAGTYTPDRGSIFVNETQLTQKSRAHLIAQVIQDVNKGTIPEMSLLENMVLSQIGATSGKLAFYERFATEITQKVRDLGIGLEDAMHQPLAQLSGGQRQMVATMMAIESNPSILLLDEHTSALDPKMQRKLMTYTAQAVASRRLTTIMITHKLDDAILYGNRLIMLNRGKIVFDISGAEKAALEVHTLLDLFHQYEDRELISGEGV